MTTATAQPSKPTLRSTEPPTGVNEPAATPTSLDLNERINAAEQARLDALEARYGDALRRSVAGDNEAIEQLIDLARQLNLSTEQVGADRETLLAFTTLSAIDRAWTADDQATFDAQSQAIRDHGDEKAAIRRWNEQRLSLMQAREPLLIRLRRVEAARAAIDEMRRDKRSRRIIEGVAEAAAT